MSWVKQENGTWYFIRKPGESYQESLKRCMSDSAHTACKGDWLALLVIATDIIAGRLNPPGTSKPFGTSFQLHPNSESRPQDAE